MIITLRNTKQEQAERIIRAIGAEKVTEIFINNKEALADITLEAPFVGIGYKVYDGSVKTRVKVGERSVVVNGFVMATFGV